jgi:hypothetical protein
VELRLTWEAPASTTAFMPAVIHLTKFGILAVDGPSPRLVAVVTTVRYHPSTTNDYALFEFSGTQVKIFTAAGTSYGFASVSICNAHGNYCGTETLVDLYYQTGAVDNHLTWVSPILSQGTWTVKWLVAGSKNPSSSGYTVTLDRVVYS